MIHRTQPPADSSSRTRIPQPGKAFRAVAVVAAATLMTALGACSPVKTGTTGTVGDGPAVQLAPRVDAIADTVPPEIRQAGQLKIAMTVGMAPLNAPDTATGEMEGLNPDLARQLGAVMGLDVQIQGATMDQILPGMQAGRYDVTMSNMDISADRLEVLDFVEYYFSATSLGVQEGNPQGLSVEDLCGKSIGVSNGSFQMTKVLPKQSKKCVDAGRPPVDIQAYPDQQKAALALISGRVDGTCMDGPVLLYASQLEPRITDLGKITDGSNVGIGVRRGSGMTETTSKALQYLIDNGQYQKILTRYGMDSVQIKEAKVHTQ